MIMPQLTDMGQFIKFALVGVINTTIHYTVFYTLYRYLGVYHLLASTSGFMLAVINSYMMNRYWTFNSSADDISQEFFRFFLISVFAFFVNLAGMFLLVEYLLVAPPLAQFLTIIITLIINFTFNRYWVFRVNERS